LRGSMRCLRRCLSLASGVASALPQPSLTYRRDPSPTPQKNPICVFDFWQT